MAGKSSTYNPKSFGKGVSLMPEGIHKFMVEENIEWNRGKSPAWKLSMQPMDSAHAKKDNKPYLLWLNQDGCVEALFDAAGVDPALVQAGREYEPEEFEHKEVMAEVVHKEIEIDTDEGPKQIMVANVLRLYPVFSMGGTVAQAASTVPSRVSHPNTVPTQAELPASMRDQIDNEAAAMPGGVPF